MGAIVGAAAGGAVVGIMIGRNAAKTQKGVEAASISWKELEGRGLTLTVDKRPRLQGTLQGRQVEVRIETDAVQCARTEISARLSAPSNATIAVLPSPEGVLSKVRDWIHHDIQIGVGEFDPYYLITGKPEEAVKQLLSKGSLRDRILGLGTDLAGFEYAKDRVLVVLGGVATDVEVLGIALDLAVEAAGVEL